MHLVTSKTSQSCNTASSAYTGGRAIVHTDFKGNNPIEIGAALDISFGAAGWLALTLHAVGVEVYLALTPREGQRLRQVSYERQVEAGMRNPGSAGVVVEKLGDAEPWRPKGSASVKPDESE